MTPSPILFAEYAKLAKTFGMSKLKVESADGAHIEMEFGNTPEETLDLAENKPKSVPGMDLLADLLNVPVELVKGPPQQKGEE